MMRRDGKTKRSGTERIKKAQVATGIGVTRKQRAHSSGGRRSERGHKRYRGGLRRKRMNESKEY